MTDYTELLELLRYCSSQSGCIGCKLSEAYDCTADLTRDAAAAIEDLQDTVQAQDKALKECARQLAKIQREAQEETDEPAGSWMVYKAGSKPKEFWYFVEWINGKAIIGNRDGMIFTYEGMAQHVAEKLGEGWKVIDISQEAYRKAERLMAAIFAEPPKEDA